MKEMIDISKLLVKERLIETIHKEQLIFCVGKFDIKTLINGEIECTMGNKTYANKETIDNNEVFFKLSNIITWKSTDLKDDYSYNANDKYSIISQWLTIVLQESRPIDITTQHYNPPVQKSSTDVVALKNVKTSHIIDLSSNHKGVHRTAIKKMILRSICNRWIKYEVDMYHISLNTKRIKNSPI